jgi:phage shock protein PspC (stress-responsive transcriptional regulator)
MERRLYRSRNDRTLAGVCAGIAEYFGWDPTLVRVAWVLLTLLGGSGILLYLIMWLVVPEAP